MLCLPRLTDKNNAINYIDDENDASVFFNLLQIIIIFAAVKSFQSSLIFEELQIEIFHTHQAIN